MSKPTELYLVIEDNDDPYSFQYWVLAALPTAEAAEAYAKQRENAYNAEYPQRKQRSDQRYQDYRESVTKGKPLSAMALEEMHPWHLTDLSDHKFRVQGPIPFLQP